MRQIFVLLALLSSFSHVDAIKYKFKRRRPKSDESYNGGSVVLTVRPKPWRRVTTVQFRVKPPGQKPLDWKDGKPSGEENKKNKKWYTFVDLPSSSPGVWIWRVRVVNPRGKYKRSDWRRLVVTGEE